MLPLGRELDPNAALLSPRGKVSENGAPRFFRRFAEGVFDEADVIQRAHELADFVAAAAGHYGFDAARVTAVGYSNGANIAAAILLLRPETLAGAILFRAMVPLAQPPAASDLRGKPVLISAGAADPIIPRENAERLVGLLKERGAPVTFHVQEAGHGLDPRRSGRGQAMAGHMTLRGAHLRVARATDQMSEVVRFYCDGLGFEILGSFEDHAGFDGVMLGHAGSGYHLEFTHRRGERAGRAPTEENLLVFYLPDRPAGRRRWSE